ncbi:site-specific integrase [Planomonospora sp. ID82291]|uniref:tyrosine-type recombinase/integrase n=1 Tax=Planomonospora sp. ID82291 TaxID=2738136 RepID=UPI0018C3FEAD|nr:site-specific integrase [Planomonospora sp. ID82291]MBG0814636.1 tyrosine-type recombinase/integrase [Planomonospora sp. ID82291]
MARIIERTAKSGAKSWLVKWRIGGGRAGKEDFETCYDRTIAESFAELVEDNGERRPPGYPKGCHGLQDPRFRDDRTPGMPTFEAYARTEYAGRPGASPTQRFTYLTDAERHVFPFLGHLRLDEVTRRVLREWAQQMLTKPSARNAHQPHRPLSDEQAARRWAQTGGPAVKPTGRVSPDVLRRWREAGSPRPARPDQGTLSPATVTKIYRGSIRPVLRAAMRQGEDGEPPLLRSSPCDGFRLPPAPVRVREVLYGPEVAVYLTAVGDVDRDTALFIVTMTATGLRWGELAGLHVSGLDAAGCVIHVVQTYARLLNEHTGRWEWRIEPYPKGKKRRDVPISEESAGLLSGRVQGKRSDEPLFQKRTGGYIDYGNQHNDILQPALTLALARERGLARHITPHALRHRMITMLRDAACPPG